MARFVIYDTTTKAIRSFGEVSDSDVALQAIPPGCAIETLDPGTMIPQGSDTYDPVQKTFGKSLVNVKKRQADIVKTGAYNYIQAGFTSSAKGAPLIYDTSTTEQTNMLLSAFGGGGLMAKANSNGIFAPSAHTQVQARQVVADFVAYRDAALQKLATLGTQIRNAATVADVQAVVWSPP